MIPSLDFFSDIEAEQREAKCMSDTGGNTFFILRLSGHDSIVSISHLSIVIHIYTHILLNIYK